MAALTVEHAHDTAMKHSQGQGLVPASLSNTIARLHVTVAGLCKPDDGWHAAGLRHHALQQGGLPAQVGQRGGCCPLVPRRSAARCLKEQRDASAVLQTRQHTAARQPELINLTS